MKRVRQICPDVLSVFLGGRTIITNPNCQYCGILSSFDFIGTNGLTVGKQVAISLDDVRELAPDARELEVDDGKLAGRLKKDYKMSFTVTELAMACGKNFVAFWDKRAKEKVVIELPKNGKVEGH